MTSIRNSLETLLPSYCNVYITLSFHSALLRSRNLLKLYILNCDRRHVILVFYMHSIKDYVLKHQHTHGHEKPKLLAITVSPFVTILL